jgi:ribosomal-protein-alanine N-acetyltransferase
MLAAYDDLPAIRLAHQADLSRIVWLEDHSFPDPWPPAILAHELSHPRSFILVASRAGGPATGYVSFRQGVDEGERRRGVGRALVHAGLDRLRAARFSSCFLEVRPDNTPAIALYESLGFAPNGRRRAYYRDGSDALVYALDL